MSYDKSKDTVEHLDEVLRRIKLAQEAVPGIQRARELASWQYDATRELRTIVPREIFGPIESSAAEAHERVTKAYPMLPLYQGDMLGDLQMTAGTTSATASSNMAAFVTLVQINGTPGSTPRVPVLVHKYTELVAQHGRVSEARDRLAKTYRNLVSLFNEAESAVAIALMDDSKSPAAANAMRNILDKFRGELISSARTHPNENQPAWDEIARRLTRSRDQTLFKTFADQGAKRDELVNNLSGLLKVRFTSGIPELSSAWTLTVDHIYIVCGCLLAGPSPSSTPRG